MKITRTYTVLLEQRLLSLVEIEAGSRYEAYTAARDLIVEPEYTHRSDKERIITLGSNQWLEHTHSIRTVRLAEGP